MAEYPDKADRRRALTVDTEPPPPPPPPKEALRLRQQMWEVGEVQRQEIRARALAAAVTRFPTRGDLGHDVAAVLEVAAAFETWIRDGHGQPSTMERP